MCEWISNWSDSVAIGWNDNYWKSFKLLSIVKKEEDQNYICMCFSVSL